MIQILVSMDLNEAYH